MVIQPAKMRVAAAASNIFDAPIGTGPPPAFISRRGDHPVPRLGVQQSSPISTNKFYQNFFLGSQASITVLHPYSVTWVKGGGATQSWGLSVSHIEASQFAFGPTQANGANQYFINPIGIQSLVLSAAELGPGTVLNTTQATEMSVLVQLRSNAAAAPTIQFPLVQGSGFVTAQYNGGTPVIQSGIFFASVTKVNVQPRPGVTKYKITLNDGKNWLLYAYSTSGLPLDLQVINNGLVRSSYPFFGTIQVAKDPGNAEALYDAASGQYAASVVLSGTTSGMRGEYTFSFVKAGLTGAPLLMYALPHHVQSFDATTAAAVRSNVQLQTTTKGKATAVVADAWKMVELRLPISMSFLPWSNTEGTKNRVSAAAKAKILQVAQSELSQDMDTQSNLNSMYYSGKALAKFAMILSVVYDLLGESALAAAGLEKLKAAMARFATNRQIYPLVYESAWGGLVSSASYVTGDSGADFGNTYYNDHHFHYGYHVLAAAVIGHLDPTWLPANRDWVNTLVRDYANPSTRDPYFPTNRMFDWFHGHSFAHGLYESADGRDQESSSEDVMASYALKMWGLVSGDANLAARGNLQLSVLARSLNLYYLYTSDNTVQPASFIGNKVAGILFENKIDHVTYFGANIEYIQGIHMLPLLPATKLVRGDRFVSEEWAQYFSNGRADAVVGGWRGVLYGNLATIDPRTAWNFFSSSTFDPSWLDGGASLTWYLAYAAGESMFPD
ncbi:putative glycoside hydrolase family 81 protein [Diaporthe ampelina]|uniref:glucan endo-1,3-beta-D-glucosidase n=1 Tax=Diaporthe ampelina TaxID=1214573 RepID=A0A0G2FV16_9PEZI|nr:putative glycoside hydrolase family 81 protein [Diaporthe ampelina]